MSSAIETYTKKDIKDFWNRNVCQTEFIKAGERGSRQFFEEAEKIRYKYHFYLPLLFDEISRKYAAGKLLEVGCGMGTDLLQLARRGMNTTGIDITEEGINLAKIRFELYSVPTELKVDDAENLSFSDNSFDVVYSFGVLHHTPDTQKSIDEVLRVLKPGGSAIIMLYHRRSFNYVVHRILNAPFDGNRKDRCPIERAYTKKEVYEMFRNFQDVSIDVQYFMTTGYGIVWDMLPIKMHQIFGGRWGWHLVIKGLK